MSANLKTLRDFLASATLTREEVDRFLNPAEPNWAKHDPELGYSLRNSVCRDGLHGSCTLLRLGPGGERLMVNFAEQPCRLNTYGDSFTQCQQVNDGETWQEYLAAHLGEPVRNYGVGGYGFYQAWRRMQANELTPNGAPYVILNLFGMDDHYRSIDSWRWLRCVDWFRDPANKFMFHCNPWDYLRVDPASGQFVECPSLCPTPESLYRLCDKDYVLETFRVDVVANLYAAEWLDLPVEDSRPMERLADLWSLKLDFCSSSASKDACRRLYREYAIRASMFCVEKAEAFAREHDKQLMILLTFGIPEVHAACTLQPRPDEAFVSFLRNRNVRFVDVLEKHSADFTAFRLNPEDYIGRHFIGHYNPAGNHFLAFAVKNEIVAWLDPKPPTYQSGHSPVQFKHYLTGL